MEQPTGKRAEDEDRRLAAGPVAIGGLINTVARPVLRGRGGALARLALDWPEVVGPALAAVTAPERLAGGTGGGTLTIRASGPMALELAHLAPELIARINAHLGRDAVARLRFAQGSAGRAGRSPPETPLPPRRPGREAAARAAAAVAALPEGPLKEALARLGAQVMARR